MRLLFGFFCFVLSVIHCECGMGLNVDVPNKSTS